MPSPLLQPSDRPDDIPDPYLIYLGRLKPGESQRTMRGALDGITDLILREEYEPDQLADMDPPTGEGRPWWLLRVPDTRHIQELLVAGKHSPATVNKYLSALRGVLETCWEAGLMPADDCMRAVRELRTLPVGKVRSGRNT